MVRFLLIALFYYTFFEAACASPVVTSSSTSQSLETSSDVLSNELPESNPSEYPDGIYRIPEDGGGPILIKAIPSDFDFASLNFTEPKPSSQLSPFPNAFVRCNPDANLGSILDAESYHHFIMRGLIYDYWYGNDFLGHEVATMVVFGKIMVFFCNMKNKGPGGWGIPLASTYMQVNDLLEQRCGSRVPGSAGVLIDLKWVYGRSVLPPPRFMPIVANFFNLCQSNYQPK